MGSKGLHGILGRADFPLTKTAGRPNIASQPGFVGCETVESDSPMYIAPRKRGGGNAHLRVGISALEWPQMPTNARLAATLADSLHLRQIPIAVRFADAVPDGMKTFSGTVAAGCRFWQEAALETFATVARQHDLCGIGLYTHNLGQTPATQTDLGDTLKVFADLGYVREQDLPLIPVLNRPAKVVIYGPLAESRGMQDVVLLFVRADQALVLSEASQQIEGGLPPAMGRPACAVIPHAVNTGRTALSLGCCGARAYLAS